MDLTSGAQSDGTLQELVPSSLHLQKRLHVRKFPSMQVSTCLGHFRSSAKLTIAKPNKSAMTTMNLEAAIAANLGYSLSAFW